MTELDHLWAGWRSEFVSRASGKVPEGGPNGCVFCAILTSGLPDEEAYVVWRHPSGRVAVLLNAYPYTSGHFMAMPVRHVAELEDLTPAEASEVWEALARGVRALKSAYKPDGINVGANLGRAAGAGVPAHFHLHALPRWTGDTNFMTTVASARVLPEPLDESAAKLRSAWPAD
jgi:ATP adenylyltransferase